MLSPKYYNSPRINATSLLRDREYGNWDCYLQRRLQASSPYIDRLEQEGILKGHEGCVNCIEWSSDGRILASGSDDLHVILWEAFSKRSILRMPTKHLGNVFSVKFLPRHNDAIIATCAADKHVYVYDLNRHNETILNCHCHAARVKRLATAPDSPNVFWSAGEDGAIMQLDIREPHRCRDKDNTVRLINLPQQLDQNAEAKCVAINPRRSEYMAVGANDPYARIYDRRLIKPVSSFIGGSSGANGMLISGRNPFASVSSTSAPQVLPRDCVTYYCPGHINKITSRFMELESHAITYLTFNDIGTELLVNLGGEHIYLYDLQCAEQPVYLDLPEYVPPAATSEASEKVKHAEEGEEEAARATVTPANTTTSESSHRRKLPESIEVYKKMGNDFLENEKYLRAIEQYSEAISLAPDCAVLYLNRATAYMRRLWFGDVYAAMRDCHEALRLDPSYIKAHFRLARALLELRHAKEADECLTELINRFPSYASNHGVMMLAKDIKEQRQPKKTSNNNNNAGPSSDTYSYIELSDNEFHLRSKAKDYTKRYVGHLNTTTDIKEVNFFGHDNKFIVAGSDDGNFYIWERDTGKIRAAYKADIAIVNCVQPHPFVCALATSGIDHDIKLWSPIAESPDRRNNLISNIDKCVEDNQMKMKTDPFALNPSNTICLNG